jgi:ABC-type phosphate/phosphonate transport system ATPase subunit
MHSENEGMKRANISYFARSNFRDKRTLVGIEQPDRLLHLYVIGKTGVGKSTLIETLARQDLDSDRGFALIDPHGDLAARVFAAMPEEQQSRVVYAREQRTISVGFCD